MVQSDKCTIFFCELLQNLVEKQRRLGQLEVEARQFKADLAVAEIANGTLQGKLKEADAANEVQIHLFV